MSHPFEVANVHNAQVVMELALRRVVRLIIDLGFEPIQL